MLRASTQAEFTGALPRWGAGIALTLNRADGTHVGIIYRYQGGVLLCHLAAPFDLRNEAPSPRYFWEKLSLRERRSQILTSYIRLVLKHNGSTIPYGFGYDGTYFDDSGKFSRAQEPGIGLNCATFIMALDQSLKIPLLKEDTSTKRPEDAEARRKLVLELVSLNPAIDLSPLTPFIEGVRFRPEEVVAAGISNLQPPIALDIAEPAGKLLDEFIRKRLK